MGLEEKLGETALDLVKNENVQNKAADLLGMLFPYIGIKKKAVDMYIEEIENSDLSTEAKMVSLLNAKKTLKKIKNQKNIAEIAKENAKEGTDFSEKSGVSEEWFDRFMESASYVSSEEMQLVWGKILANEFGQPGCTPRNMTRILSEFTQNYAKAFRTLCSMRVLLVSINEDEKIVGANWKNAIVFDQNEEYMRKIGLSFKVLNELETLGVIKFDTVAGYATTNMKEKKVLVYVNGNTIETSHRNDNFPIGNVLFTSAGEALSKITEPYKLEGYEEAVKKYLKSNNVIVEEESLYNVVVLGDRIQVNKKKQ
jgi:hypothetical protein